jgi:hypothetical protein
MESLAYFQESWKGRQEKIAREGEGYGEGDTAETEETGTMVG